MEDVIIYRKSGQQQTLSKEYMREMLYNITSDTTNTNDVYLDVAQKL